MVRRHLRKLELDGFIKTIKNARGGKPGDTRHYKITFTEVTSSVITQTEKLSITTPSDEFFTSVMKERDDPPRGINTPPADDSQTIKQPLLTYKELIDKFGYGWEHDPNRSCLVGKYIGIEARPGELNGPYVARLMEKLRMKSLI